MKITKQELKKLIQEEVSRLSEARQLPGLGDAPGPAEPDYSGEPEVSHDEQAIIAADQIIDTFEQGNFDVALQDALGAIGVALKQRAARSGRLAEAGRSLPEWPNMVERAQVVLGGLVEELGNREVALQAIAEAVRNMRRG